jgi:cytoskeletal protein CcmA (bactofilin family)
MKKIISFLSATVALLVCTTIVFAQGNQKQPTRTTLQRDEVVDKDYFAAGEIVEIYGTVNGDVYAAGGQVIVDGEIAGDLLVAGGQVEIAGIIAQDVRATGGSIAVDADVGKNLTLVGGSVDMSSSTKVAGSAVLGAGNANLSGTIGKNLTAGVGMLNVLPDANISGDLTYYSEEEAQINESASVSGQITKKSSPVKVDTEKLEKHQNSFNVASKIPGFLSSIIIGLIILKFFPGYTKEVLEKLNESPLRSMGVGFLVLILTPIALLVVMLTIVGIPLALILLAFYFIFIYISKIFVALWVGNYVQNKAGKKTGIGWILVLGLVIYYVLAATPQVGGFVIFISLLFGLGAMLTTCRSYLK